MPDPSELDPRVLGVVVADREGPEDIRPGDTLYIREDRRATGLRVFDTPHGLVVARTPPPDATDALGCVVSLERRVSP